MECQHCEKNEARYINDAGEALCGVCDSLTTNTSVRGIDLPALLVHVAVMVSPTEKFAAKKEALQVVRSLLYRNNQGSSNR